MKSGRLAFGFFLAFIQLNGALASDQMGMITQLEGDVQVLSAPGKPGQGKSASIGQVVEKGNVVVTRPGAMTKIVFENGDQFFVGSSTSYQVSWDKDSSKAATLLNLEYGSLRGVVAKGGPRSRLTIRTKSAVMGVRGTDFFIAQPGSDQLTRVSVLRGNVAVAQLAAEKSDSEEAVNRALNTAAVSVKSGFSVHVAPFVVQTAAPAGLGRKSFSPSNRSMVAPSEPVEVPRLQPREVAREDLGLIEKVSVFPKSGKASVSRVSKKIQAKIRALEKRAKEMVLHDIQMDDPALFAKLKKVSAHSVEDLNRAVLEKALGGLSRE